MHYSSGMRKTGSLQEKIDKFPGGKEQIYQKKNSENKWSYYY